jgi:hypothetical protein
MSPITPLTLRFHDAMIKEVYLRAKREVNYNAKTFLSMVVDKGGLETAKQLLGTPTASSGYYELARRGRLDLTVESLVLQPGWQGLFTETELHTAKQRLGAA